MTLCECVREAATSLSASPAAGNTGHQDAEVLARAMLGWDAATWIVRQREPASDAFRTAFNGAVARRRAHEPVAYIVGAREFYGYPFRVTRDVLVPRPETELVVEEALALLARRQSDRAPRVADIGTGSGCLALALALEYPTAQVVATDVSDAALDVARWNASNLGVAGRVSCRHARLVDDAVNVYDIIVSNPPYVSEPERPTLSPDVLDHEPALALFGGDDGLDVIRALVPAAAAALVDGGWLVMEFGAGQAVAVTEIITGVLDLDHISVDLAGIPRVAVAQKPGGVRIIAP